MRTITAEEFKNAVNDDPDWAAKLGEPVSIQGYVELNNSPIRYLSTLLHFEETDVSAEFVACQNLKVAEGHFAGYVGFDFCGIKKIGDLHVRGKTRDGCAASFGHCYQLEVAEGDYPGHVKFAESGVTRIGNLICRANSEGMAADFRKCNLKTARGTYHGGVDFSWSDIQEIDPEHLVIVKQVIPPRAVFTHCNLLKVAQGKFPGAALFTNSGVTRIGKIVLPDEDAMRNEIRACFWGCDRLKDCLPEHLADKQIRFEPEKRAYLQAVVEKQARAREALKPENSMLL